MHVEVLDKNLNRLKMPFEILTMGAIVTFSNAVKNNAHAKDYGIPRQATVPTKDIGMIHNLTKLQLLI